MLYDGKGGKWFIRSCSDASVLHGSTLASGQTAPHISRNCALRALRAYRHRGAGTIYDHDGSRRRACARQAWQTGIKRAVLRQQLLQQMASL